MARYELDNESFTRIAEESGTVVNISNARVELSETAERGTGVVLYPRQSYPFSGTTLYAARERGEACPAAIAVGPPPPTGGGGGGGGDDEYATDADIGEMLDEVFG